MEELVRLSQPARATEQQKTPRTSIASVALIDDYARNLFKINNQLAEMRQSASQLGGPHDSHDLRAEMYIA